MRFSKEIKTYFLFALVILAVVFVKYYFLFQSDVFFLGKNDILNSFYPDYILLSEGIHNGSIPLWTDKISCGFPIAGYGYNAFLSPISWFFAYFFSPLTGIKILLVLLPVASALLLKRALEIFGVQNIWWQSVAMTGYLFCFFNEPNGDYPLKLSYLFSPLILALAFKMTREVSWKTTVWFGVISGLALLSFYAPFLVRLFALIVIACVCQVLFLEDEKGKKALHFIVGFVLAALIAYPQIILTQSLLDASAMADRDSDYFLEGSFPFSFWNFFHRYDWVDDAFASGRNPAAFTWWYAGLSPILILLAVFSFWSVRKKELFFLWLINALVLFAVIGRFNPLYQWMAEHDLLLQMRIPSRAFWILNVTIPVLAAFGLETVMEKGIKSKKLIPVYITLSIIALLLSGLFYFSIKKYGEADVGLVFKFYKDALINFNFSGIFREIYSLVFTPEYLSYVSSNLPFYLLGTLLLLVFPFKKNRKYIVVFGLSLLMITEGLCFSFSRIFHPSSDGIGNLKNYISAANIKELKESDRVLSLINSADGQKMLNAEMNIVFGFSSANYHAEALYLKDYEVLLKKAKQEALEGKTELLQRMGITGVFSGVEIPQWKVVKKLPDGTLWYSIPGSSKVWGITQGQWQAIPNYQWSFKGNTLSVSFQTEKTQYVVLAVNLLKGHKVVVDGAAISPEKWHSFLCLKNLEKGKHTIEITYEISALL